MEAQTLSEKPDLEFQPGAPVIYAMHGKCKIVKTEIRILNGENIRFYKLEVRKSSFSRSTRQEPAIWVPVTTAKDLGLRSPMTPSEAELAMKCLTSREYYFDPHEAWYVVHPKLESSLRLEGGIGLAKVASFLFVLKKKQIVASSEVLKLQDTVQKLLFREMADALDLPIKVIEEKVFKGFKSKLIPDN